MLVTMNLSNSFGINSITVLVTVLRRYFKTQLQLSFIAIQEINLGTGLCIKIII